MNTEILRIINAVTTPIALFLSVFLVTFAFRALRNAYRREKKIVATSLLGVGLIFFINAFVLSFTYLVIFTSNDRDLVNLLANSRILLSNILTIVTSVILLGIYSNRI